MQIEVRAGGFRPVAGSSLGDIGVQQNLITGTTLMGQIAVGTVAVDLKVGSSDLAKRRTLYILAPAAITLGTANTVTTTTGFTIPANTLVILNFDPDKPVTVWAIAAASTQVSLIEG